MENPASPTLAGLPHFPQCSTLSKLPESPTLSGFPQLPHSPHGKTQNLSAFALKLEAIHEAYEERAAILEFDAGISRTDAEEAARRMTGYEGA